MSRTLPHLTSALFLTALMIMAPTCAEVKKDSKDAGSTADGAAKDGTAKDGAAADGTGAKDTYVPTEGCSNTPKPATDPGDAVCAVEKSGSGLLVVADVLLPGKVIEGGAVLLDGKGDITCVGCDCVAKATDATWVICPDAVVSPGLIDAHNHVGWLNEIGRAHV